MSRDVRAKTRTAAGGLVIPGVALVLLMLGASPASALDPLEMDISLGRFLTLGQEDNVETILGADEGDESRILSREQLEAQYRLEEESGFQEIERYASRRLSNMRFCFTIYNHAYREIKEGTAGWGHYDDLFQSGVFNTDTHFGEATFPLPTGGVEIGYIGAPLYTILMGTSYDIYTGQDWLGNEFDDLVVNTWYVGLKFNLVNEFVAAQRFSDMFQYQDPPHITGLNIFVRATAGIAVTSQVGFSGAFAGAGDSRDGYFRQSECFAWYVGGGFEYRLATIGLFFEAGYNVMHHPEISRPLVKANHFRTFPVMVGISVYFQE